MNEIKLLNTVLPGLRQGADIFVGPGDDCAAIDIGGSELLLLAADQVVSEVHYLPDTAPAKIAGKLLKRNLSDIAAMGGIPAHAILSIASSRSEQWFIDFYRGLAEVSAAFGVSVCGGDIASLPESYDRAGEVASLTITGKVTRQKLCLRKNARPGDLLFCTGCFGNSFNSGHHLDFMPRLDEAAFIAGEFTNAVIDVSDGLLLDLERMATASGVDVILDCSTVPLRAGADIHGALTDGEDYELLFAVPREKVEKLERNWKFEQTGVTCIGRFAGHGAGVIYDMNNNNLSEKINKGYEHFRR